MGPDDSEDTQHPSPSSHTEPKTPLPRGIAKAGRLRVVLATSIPELKDSYYRACRAVWAARLSEKTYKTFRDSEFANATWMANGAGQLWCLVDTEDPHTALSGCVTWRMKVSLKRQGTQDIESGVFYRIDSNVTPEDKRKRGFNGQLLEGVHRALASPSSLIAYPARWVSEPLLTSSQRDQIPYADGSFLRTEIHPNHYARSTVGVDGPGWELVPETESPMTWATRIPMNADGLPMWEIPSIDTVVNEHWWQLLRNRDLVAVIETLGKTAAERLTNADSSQCTLIQMDPASPGVLTMAHELNEYFKAFSSRVHDWDLKEEPIGLRKGDTITLLTRRYTSDADTILVTHLHNLKSEDLPVWTDLLDVLSRGYRASRIMIHDLDPASDVAKMLIDTRAAKPVAATHIKLSPLMKILYSGIPSNDPGRVLDTQRQLWP